MPKKRLPHLTLLQVGVLSHVKKSPRCTNDSIIEEMKSLGWVVTMPAYYQLIDRCKPYLDTILEKTPNQNGKPSYKKSRHKLNQKGKNELERVSRYMKELNLEG